MLSTSEFIEYLDKGEIPPSPPIIRGHSPEDFRARSAVTERGMWALVYKDFARELVAWIGDRKVLEVMAGRGWLAKALSNEGIEIVATDDSSWDNKHSKATDVFPIHKMGAIEAIRKLGGDFDVLLMSWPPYSEDVAFQALKVWGTDKPVIYIGEGYGGCNATDSFFEHWKEVGKVQIPLVHWGGLHDHVEIGYYRERLNEV